jgi:Protein of unknown function (DUF1236)
MRNKLLATVAVAAVVGFGGFAAAQSQMGATPGATGATSGATHEKSGGMSGTQSGNKTLNPSSSQSSNPSPSQSAQEKSGKDNERLGQGPKEEQNESARGAQHENEQKGAQQERGFQKNQKGAQEERGSKLKGAHEERGERGNLKGAQEQRGTNMKGAEERRGTDTERNATGQNDRTGVNVGERGERGGSVQLSEDQRSRIKTIVGRERGPRLGRNVDFSLTVGTRIPRSVHYAVLPEDIVRIVPQYRGFDYFLVEDEIVIVDPRTLEIVAVIPA